MRIREIKDDEIPDLENIYILEKTEKYEKVIMEHLNENIKSEGFYLFTGKPFNLKPTKKLSNHELKEMIKHALYVVY